MSEHSHPHEHHHEHAEGHASMEETLALLTYMVNHNRHHAEEIHEIAHGIDGVAADLLHDAVDYFERGNEKLELALAALKESDT